VVVTTLPDPRLATSEELAELYRARWHAELDLWAIKAGMQMRELRGKAPETVRKEVWDHVLAYNLVRTVMAQAAAAHGLAPRSVSFTGAMQTLAAFRPLLEGRAAGRVADRAGLYRDLLAAVAAPRVGDRPDRFEPRVKKRRRNHYGWLTRPRAEMKREMTKRRIEK
jgi:Transposase DDE domain